MKVTVQDGLNGSAEYADTTLHKSLNVSIIQFLTDTVFDELHGNAVIQGINTSTGVVTAGATYVAGTALYGKFHALKLASGSVRCYNAPPKTL
jgi:hypothetical protein